MGFAYLVMVVSCVTKFRQGRREVTCLVCYEQIEKGRWRLGFLFFFFFFCFFFLGVFL
jgi:hypothetical protein